MIELLVLVLLLGFLAWLIVRGIAGAILAVASFSMEYHAWRRSHRALRVSEWSARSETVQVPAPPEPLAPEPAAPADPDAWKSIDPADIGVDVSSLPWEVDDTETWDQMLGDVYE